MLASAQAYAVVQNNNNGRMLICLHYHFLLINQQASRKDDVITVRCDADIETLGKHGFITDKTEQKYKADKLSTYVTDVLDIDKK